VNIFLATLLAFFWSSTAAADAPQRYKVVVFPTDTSPTLSRVEGPATQELTHLAYEMTIQHMIALKRFDVVERAQLDKILEEQKLHLSGLLDEAQAIRVGKIAASDIGLMVQGLSLNQAPVEKTVEEEVQEEEEISSKGLKKSKTTTTVKRKRIIQSIKTDISISLKRLAIEDGTTMETIIIKGSETGPDASTSKEAALRELSHNLSQELRRMFALRMQIGAIVDGMIQARAGESIGVMPGMYFRVVREEQVKRGLHEGTVRREIGLVEVKEVSSTTFEAGPVRRFGDFKVGDQLYEQVDIGFSVGVLATYHPNLAAGMIQLELAPYQPMSFGIFLQAGAAKDNTSTNVLSIGLGLNGGWKFLRTDWFQIALEANLGLLLGLRPDDAGKSVNALGVAFGIGPSLEIFFSKDLSFYIQPQYKIASALSQWDFYDQGKKNPATWTGAAPSVDTNGFHTLVGLKWSFF